MSVEDFVNLDYFKTRNSKVRNSRFGTDSNNSHHFLSFFKLKPNVFNADNSRYKMYYKLNKTLIVADEKY